jgi:hypothetical protein
METAPAPSARRTPSSRARSSDRAAIKPDGSTHRRLLDRPDPIGLDLGSVVRLPELAPGAFSLGHLRWRAVHRKAFASRPHTHPPIAWLF